MKFNIKTILIAVAAILIIMQFFGIDKENPTSDASKDFIQMTNPPQKIATILKTACYDCHSNETAYPWYTNVQPVGWWVGHHIEEGREHLNFSSWGDYKQKRKSHKLEEFYEEVEEGEMPLSSYTLAHADAKLSSEDKEALITWVKGLPDFKEEH